MALFRSQTIRNALMRAITPAYQLYGAHTLVDNWSVLIENKIIDKYSTGASDNSKKAATRIIIDTIYENAAKEVAEENQAIPRRAALWIENGATVLAGIGGGLLGSVLLPAWTGAALGGGLVKIPLRHFRHRRIARRIHEKTAAELNVQTGSELRVFGLEATRHYKTTMQIRTIARSAGDYTLD